MNVTINASESNATAVSVTAVATDTSAVSSSPPHAAAIHETQITTSTKIRISSTTTTHARQISTPNSDTITTARPPRTNRASLPATPRYAMPTAASVRREEATLRTLNGVSKPDSHPSTWRQRPTKPRSPNFRSRHRRTSMISRPVSMPSIPTKSVPMGRRLPVTTPKSPLFRSRGPARRPTSENKSPDRCFVPTPLPGFLKRGDVLPNIKLNAKTMAAMERRNNPDAARRQEPRPLAVRRNLQPTVPEPFELRCVEKHEMYQSTAEHRRVQREEEESLRRQFEATKLDENILAGPTFVLELNGVPLTDPVDLLPHSKERSERTLAFEQMQRDRLAEQARLADIEAKQREEDDDFLFKQEQEERKFKPVPIPKSHYVPDMVPRASSVASASVQDTQSSRSFSRSMTSTTDTSSVQDDTVAELATVSTKGMAVSVAEVNTKASIVNGQKKGGGSKKRIVKGEETSKAVESASDMYEAKGEKRGLGMTESAVGSETAGAGTEPRTPAMDFDIEKGDGDNQTPDGMTFAKGGIMAKAKAGGEESSDVTTATESPMSETGSTWLIQKMRNSLSPLLGVAREAKP